MRGLTSDTPQYDFSVDDVPNLIHDDFRVSPKIRLNYIKMLYDVLGYDLSPDVALASVSEAMSELVLSTAGGGKTTWSQIKVIQQKLLRKIPGDKILCLVYNKHNVEDMKRKHARMVAKLYSANIKGLDIDDRIHACTMHSFCDFLRKLFVAKLGLVGSVLLEDWESEQYMGRALKLECKIAKRDDYDRISVKDMLALYTLTKETLQEVGDLQSTDVFANLDQEVDFLELCFSRYETMKQNGRKYDFIDILYKVYELLRDDLKCREEVQKYYKYVVADEVQDFTPLMWEILKLFVSNGTPLTCVGDEDQNIYLFRGAELTDILEFGDRFSDARVYLLTENRRCPEVVLNEAKRVISENELRFAKVIRGSKSGGRIDLHPYSSIEGEYINIVREIESLTAEEREKTVICYRNMESSAVLVDMLCDAGVTVNCLRSYMPYSHELYRHVIGILNALEMPADVGVWQVLWKVLPVKKQEFHDAIHYNPNLRVIEDKINFKKFNFGKIAGYNKFKEIMQFLCAVSDCIQTRPLQDYFPKLWELLCKYFWDFRKRGEMSQSDKDLLLLVEKRVYSTFNVPKTFPEVYKSIQHKKDITANNTHVGSGVTLSTFHSLKGLEFDRVLTIDMNNDVFPNYPLIEYKKYSQIIEQRLKEAETRLWYVAVTRSKAVLSIYYYEANPSKYVAEYIASVNMGERTVPAVSLEDEIIAFEENDEMIFPDEDEIGNLEFVSSDGKSLASIVDSCLASLQISEHQNSEPVEDKDVIAEVTAFSTNTTQSSLKNLIDML